MLSSLRQKRKEKEICLFKKNSLLPRVEGDVFVCAAEKLLLSPSLHIYIYIYIYLLLLLFPFPVLVHSWCGIIDKKNPIHECHHHHHQFLKKDYTKKIPSFFIFLAQKYKTKVETKNNQIIIIIIFYSYYYISFKRILFMF